MAVDPIKQAHNNYFFKALFMEIYICSYKSPTYKYSRSGHFEHGGNNYVRLLKKKMNKILSVTRELLEVTPR